MSDVWEQKHFNLFWQRMIEANGKRFSYEYGEIPNQSWIEALRELTFDQVKYAIDEGKRMGDEHPPTLAKFCYRAKQHGKKPVAAHNDVPKLPKPEITEEQTQQNRERMKSMKTRKAGGRRCIFLPGELPHHFENAKAKAIADGMTEQEFKHQRMEQNGWSQTQEEDFLKSFSTICLDSKQNLMPCRVQKKSGPVRTAEHSM